MENSAILDAELADLDLEVQGKETEGHIRYHHAVRFAERDRWVSRLFKSGIDAQKDYCTDCSRLEPFRERRQAFSVAARLSKEVLFFPNQPSLQSKDMKAIALCVRNIFQKEKGEIR